MRSWIGIHLPLLALETLRPRWSEPGRHVVLERERVWVMSRLAAAEGVRSGMRKAGVLTICPDATLHIRNVQQEQDALDSVALALLQYTPEVALAEEASLLLDVTASLRVFGGRRRLCQQVRDSIHALGFTVQIGMGPTAQGAWLLARQQPHADTAPNVRDGIQSVRGSDAQSSLRRRSVCRQRRVVKSESLINRLDALPCSLLPAVRPYQDWLQEIDCRTLGDMRKLPRAGLQRRCNKALLDALDCAYGEAPELFAWMVAPPTFAARLELPDRIEHAEAVLFAARRLILQMIGWLVAHQFAVSRFVLLLEHERGRAAIAPSEIEVALLEPTWKEPHLLRLLKERLERVVLRASVIAIRLEAPHVTPMQATTDALFPEPGGTPQDYHRLLELLSARLGEDCVLTPAMRADHRPEVCNNWTPALRQVPSHARASTHSNVKSERLAKSTLSGTGKNTASTTRANAKIPACSAIAESAGKLRPFWLLAQPVALLMRDHRPFYGSPLRTVSGPERIESGWWDGGLIVRDYFVAQGDDAACYWIYRERAADGWQWFLHGLFA